MYINHRGGVGLSTQPVFDSEWPTALYIQLSCIARRAVNIRQSVRQRPLVTSTSVCIYVRTQWQASWLRATEAGTAGSQPARVATYPTRPHTSSGHAHRTGARRSLARPITIGHVTIPSANRLLSISARHYTRYRLYTTAIGDLSIVQLGVI